MKLPFLNWKIETFYNWCSISRLESKVFPVNWRTIFLKHCTTRAKIYPPYFIVQQTICQGSFGVLSKSIIFQMASMGSSVMTPSHHWQRQLTLETGPRGLEMQSFIPDNFFFQVDFDKTSKLCRYIVCCVMK